MLAARTVSRERVFPIGDTGARQIVKRASRKIVSKVILRHGNLSTTQRYFGKVSDTKQFDG